MPDIDAISESLPANARRPPRRLYRLIEDGTTEQDAFLSERIAKLRADRNLAVSTLERTRAGACTQLEITPLAVERFGQLMRHRLTTGEIAMRKAWLSSVVDRIEVDQNAVRIIGRRELLAQAMAATAAPADRVRTFVRKWRAVQDKSANTYVIEVAI